MPSFYAPLRPLLAKEIREVLGGRALWTMLLLLCPLLPVRLVCPFGFSAGSSVDWF